MIQLNNTRKKIVVAAAALCNPQAHILLALRPKHRPMPDLWELPGGKARPGETPAMTLIRELQEELAITISCKDLLPLTVASHAYKNFSLLMPVFVCHQWQGQPQARIHRDLSWTKAADLLHKPCPDADITVFKILVNYLAKLKPNHPDQHCPNAQNPEYPDVADPDPATSQWH